MNGIVDEFGRALVTLTIRANQDTEPTEVPAWIDTAFNGELVIPRQMIEVAQLEQTAAIDAETRRRSRGDAGVVHIHAELVR